MNERLTMKLVNRFPFYRGYFKTMQETAMCWGFPGDGWYNIIRKLSFQIEKHLAKLPPLTPQDAMTAQAEPFEVMQVKEKFGGLRYYTNWEDDYITQKIREAEGMAYKTCEDCGQPGKLMSPRGWMFVACKICARKRRKGTI